MKNFKELTIADDFMFCKVMQDKDICLTFLQMVLENEIDHIADVASQKTLLTKFGAKFTRLDVLVTDDKGTLYNIEMQVVNQHNLPKRMRYYQSALDNYSLDSGSSYQSLNETFIIFVCIFDYFDKGYPIYCFENICMKDEPIFLNDGTKKVIINATAFKNTENVELRSFLEYVKTGNSTSPFTGRIEKMIETIKESSTAREEFNFVPGYIMDARAEGFEAGRSEGIEQGIEQGMQKGVHQNKLETAKSLKNIGVEIDKIATATGLTKEEIEHL